MKKIAVPVLTLLLLLALCTGCVAALADCFSDEQVISAAKSVVEVINTRDYDAVLSGMREDLRPLITADELKEAWDASLSALGSFRDYAEITTLGQHDAESGEDYAICVLVCTYENGEATYTLSFDRDYQLVGMYMK